MRILIVALVALVLVTASNVEGQDWSTPTIYAFSSSGGPGFTWDMAVGPEGRIHTVWSFPWQTPLVLYDNILVSTGKNAPEDIDTLGGVHIVFKGSDAASVFYASKPNGSTSFTIQELFNK